MTEERIDNETVQDIVEVPFEQEDMTEYPPISFGEKMNYLQKLIEAQDWSDDKAYTMGGTAVPYLSADKVFRQFAPLFRKARLVFVPRFHDAVKLDPIDKRPNHWCVQLEADVVDLDSDRVLTYNAYGEGADNQDKGIVIAETVAMRKLLSAMGFLVDGLGEGDEGSNNTGVFKKNPAEQNEIRGKILNKAVPKLDSKPAVPKIPAKVAPKEPVAEVREEPSTDNTPAPKSDFKLSDVQEKSLDNLVAMWDDKLSKGETTQDKYDQMKAARASISSMQDVMMFSKVFGKVE